MEYACFLDFLVDKLIGFLREFPWLIYKEIVLLFWSDDFFFFFCFLFCFGRIPDPFCIVFLICEVGSSHWNSISSNFINFNSGVLFLSLDVWSVFGIFFLEKQSILSYQKDDSDFVPLVIVQTCRRTLSFIGTQVN